MSTLFTSIVRPAIMSSISPGYIGTRTFQSGSNFQRLSPRLFSTKKSTTTPKSSLSSNPSSREEGFLTRFLGPKEMPPRGSFAWYREMVLLCTVFAITGSSTMVLVRPAVSNGLGLHGSLKDGPWSYRICSIVIMTPIYATLLVVGEFHR